MIAAKMLRQANLKNARNTSIMLDLATLVVGGIKYVRCNITV